MNRTFNEFENSQNNNGPISTADLENIQNNNAIDYIPNRNETNITIEPSPHSINRNLISVNNNSDGATTSTNVHTAQSNDINTEFRYENESFARSSSYAPHLQTPFVSQDMTFNEIKRSSGVENVAETSTPSTHTTTISDLSTANNCSNIDSQEPNSVQNIENNLTIERNNQISQNFNSKESNAMTECQETNTTVTDTVCEKVLATDCLQQSNANHMNIGDIESQTISQNADDAISVEEALRALDFAISGGESLLSGYEDDDYDNNTFYEDDDNDVDEGDLDSNNGSESGKEQEYQQMHEENAECTPPSNESSIKNTQTQYIDAKNVVENVENQEDVTLVKRSLERADVYEVAKSLVDSTLELCTQKLMMPTTTLNVTIPQQPQFKIDSDEIPVVAKKDTVSEETATKDIIETNLDDSLEETFVIGKLEASTPCHKTNENVGRGINKIASSLFSPLSEVNESHLNESDGVELLQKTQTKMVNATFEVEPIENSLAATFVKCDDQTFVAPSNSTCLQQTFDVETTKIADATVTVTESPRLAKISPTIKIEKDEATSDDLTTITPMNTPCELNYAADGKKHFPKYLFLKNMHLF